MMENRIELIERKLRVIIEKIVSVQELTVWKMKPGDFSAGEKIDLDDSSWKEVAIDCDWLPLSDRAWFRKKVIIPEDICGIQTSGSKIDLGLYLPSGGEVFINQTLKVKDNTWLKVDFTIKEKLKPEEPILLSIRTGTGFFGLAKVHLFIEKVNSILFQLQLFYNEIKLVQALDKWKREKNCWKLLKKVLETMDLNLLEAGRMEEFVSSLVHANKILSPLSKEIKKYTLHLIGHAHIDMNWLWTWSNTLNTTKRTFDTVENFFNEYPGFIFSQSQAALYLATEKNYPEIFQNIERRVKEKRWDITASPQHGLALFQETKELTDKALRNSLQFISQKTIYSKEYKPIIVFNSLSWCRKDIVKLKVKGKKEGIYDEKGVPIPFQKKGDGILFLAEIPSVGYRTYYLRKGLPAIQKESISVIEKDTFYHIENQFFHIRVTRESGTIINLFDKRVKREIVSSFYKERDEERYSLGANTFQLFYERPEGQQAGNAWVIGPTSKIENLISGGKVTLSEKGPVRTVLKVRHRFCSSSLLQDMVFYSDVPRIDFFTTVDWQEKGDGRKDAPMLKVAFPLEISVKEACFEIPFGYIYRPTNGKEVVGLNWADVSDKEYGISILNDCKYGCDVSGNTIRLSLIRSPYAPDPSSDIGIHKFTYSLYPHQADWRQGKTVQMAYQVNTPLIPFSIESMPLKRVNKLPETHSFLSIEPANLVLSALKKAEDNQGLILRLYESEGKKTKGRIKLNLPVYQVQETDLIEKDLPVKKKGNKFFLKFVQNEIKTLRLKFRK